MSCKMINGDNVVINHLHLDNCLCLSPPRLSPRAISSLSCLAQCEACANMTNRKSRMFTHMSARTLELHKQGSYVVPIQQTEITKYQ